MRIRIIFTTSVGRGYRPLAAPDQADLAEHMRAYGEVAPITLLQQWDDAGDAPWRRRESPERGWETKITLEQLARYLADCDRVATLVANHQWDLCGTGGAVTHTLFVSEADD